MTTETEQAEQMFQRLMVRLLADPAVSEGTGFGSTPGLRVGKKIFAMLSRERDLVVKLSKERVDELVASGTGSRFDPRRDGRLMKEWVTVPVRHGRKWGHLATEALGFVRSGARNASHR